MRIVVACALIAGCSSASTLPLSVATQPLAIAFLPADSATWTAIDQVAHSDRAAQYEIPDVDGTIAIACERADASVQVEELSATADELAGELYAPLVPWPQLACTPKPTGPLVQVTGTMVQGGQIEIGDFDGEYQPDIMFAIPVTAGIHDLVAIGQTDVLIRHDESYFEPITETPIDFGAGLTQGTMDVRPPLSVGVTTTLTTVNGTHATLPPDQTEAARYVPPELLEPGDVQTIHVIEDVEQGAFAEAFVQPGASLPPDELFTLAYPTLATIDSDAISADFHGVDPGPSVTSYRVAYANQDASLAATATQGWVRKHGTVVTFDGMFPGFRWPVLPGASKHEITIAHRGDGVVYESTLTGP